MKALTEESRICHQHIELESLNSRVFDDDMMPMKWWFSADNETMTNWAAPTGTYGCLCGILQSKDKTPPGS